MRTRASLRRSRRGLGSPRLVAVPSLSRHSRCTMQVAWRGAVEDEGDSKYIRNIRGLMPAGPPLRALRHTTCMCHLTLEIAHHAETRIVRVLGGAHGPRAVFLGSRAAPGRRWRGRGRGARRSSPYPIPSCSLASPRGARVHLLCRRRRLAPGRALAHASGQLALAPRRAAGARHSRHGLPVTAALRYFATLALPSPGTESTPAAMLNQAAPPAATLHRKPCTDDLVYLRVFLHRARGGGGGDGVHTGGVQMMGAVGMLRGGGHNGNNGGSLQFMQTVRAPGAAAEEVESGSNSDLVSMVTRSSRHVILHVTATTLLSTTILARSPSALCVGRFLTAPDRRSRTDGTHWAPPPIHRLCVDCWKNDILYERASMSAVPRDRERRITQNECHRVGCVHGVGLKLRPEIVGMRVRSTKRGRRLRRVYADATQKGACDVVLPGFFIDTVASESLSIPFTVVTGRSVCQRGRLQTTPPRKQLRAPLYFNVPTLAVHSVDYGTAVVSYPNIYFIQSKE
ncbi:hypothetical protein B0H15DRAFT_803834 [Mycena belliarum]|uniref:Uncharacterized protein n=1 Tax=Mycena belliarum TaxID=1033014 RepID=A0AAD6U0U2_9AGAR|nr:hypothetical protein B0H15DRAFT_803834 [Mycena belliae]